MARVYAIDARSGKEYWKQRVEDHEATRLSGDDPQCRMASCSCPLRRREETRSIDPGISMLRVPGKRHRASGPGWIEGVEAYIVDPPKKTGVTAVGTDTFGPSGAGIWSTPTVDRRAAFSTSPRGDNYSHPATTTSNAVVALNLKTGRIVWSQRPRPTTSTTRRVARHGTNCPADRGTRPRITAPRRCWSVTPAGREVLVAGQKSGVVYAFDPAERERCSGKPGSGTAGPRRSAMGHGQRRPERLRRGVRHGPPEKRPPCRADRRCDV